MADKFLSSISGGSEFIDGVFSGRINGSLNTGVDITLSPSAGKRIRLDRLSASGNGNQVTITVGGRVVIDNLVLVRISTNSAGEFAITGGETGDGSGLSELERWSGCRGPILGGVDEDIVLSGSSFFDVKYSFTESA